MTLRCPSDSRIHSNSSLRGATDAHETSLETLHKRFRRKSASVTSALGDHSSRPDHPKKRRTRSKVPRACWLPLDGRPSRNTQSVPEADAARNCRRRPRGLSSTIQVVQTTQRTAETRPRAPEVPNLPGGTGRLAFMLRGQPGRATQHPNRGTCLTGRAGGPTR